jgi:hypothetical protein
MHTLYLAGGERTITESLVQIARCCTYQFTVDKAIGSGVGFYEQRRPRRRHGRVTLPCPARHAIGVKTVRQR